MIKSVKRIRAARLEADVAIMLSREESENLSWFRKAGDRGNWTGWHRRHWPTNVVRPGPRVYGFDGRADQCRICALLEVERGESFHYESMSAFERQVRRITRWPDIREDAHWYRIARPTDHKPCVGLALTFRWVKAVAIDLGPIRFPQLGWLRLADISEIDAADVYPEGGRTLREHWAVERNSRLRTAARNYWRRKLGGRLRCLGCNADFEKTYGQRGCDFIEMHHEESFQLRPGERESRPEDMKPPCSNCHRMVHRRLSSMLTMTELQRIVDRGPYGPRRWK